MSDAMSILLARLRQWQGDFRPPATPAELEQLTAAAGGWLPDAVRLLYPDHNGSDAMLTKAGIRLPVRLMPIEEAIRSTHEIDAIFEEIKVDGPSPTGVLWLWTDDNSNYVGIHARGLLRGWFAVLDHEVADLSPAFRSLESFLSHLLDACEAAVNRPCSASDIPQEMPLVDDDPRYAACDRELAQRVIQAFAASTDEGERRQLAFAAMRLLPAADMDQVLTFLRHPDESIAGCALDTIRRRRYQQAVPELVQLVATGDLRLVGEAGRLLLEWQSDAAVQRELERLRLSLLQERRERLWPPPWWRVCWREQKARWQQGIACRRLMKTIRRHGLACPHCAVHSKDYRLSTGRGPSVVICRKCGWPVKNAAAGARTLLESAT